MIKNKIKGGLHLIVRRESWNYNDGVDVWIGKYRNSRNLPHWHLDCELIAVECGQLEVTCENKNYTLAQNEAFFIDSQQVHFMHAKSTDTTLTVIIFNYDIIKKYFAGKSLVCPKLNDKYDVAKLYGELKCELQSKLPFYNEAAKGLLSRFFIDVFRAEKIETRKEKTASGRLKALLDKIEKEYDTVTFEDAYDFMAMDESYFCRYFKRATGMAFTQYLNHIKIDNAIRLLKQDTGASVTSVAFACGFGSIRHFNKVFKDLTGYAPTNIPDNYSLTRYSFHTDNEFNPTLQDCILLEQF